MQFGWQPPAWGSGAWVGLSNEAALISDCRAGIPGGPGARKLVLLTSQEPDLISRCCQKAWVRALGNHRYVDRTRGLRREERKCSPKTSECLGQSHIDFFLGHLQLYPVLEKEWPRVPATSDCHRSFLIVKNGILFRVAIIWLQKGDFCLLYVKELISLDVKEKRGRMDTWGSQQMPLWLLSMQECLSVPYWDSHLNNCRVCL